MSSHLPLTCPGSISDTAGPVTACGLGGAVSGGGRDEPAGSPNPPPPTHTLGGVTQVDGRTQCFDRPQDETEAATSELGTKAGSGETEA